MPGPTTQPTEPTKPSPAVEKATKARETYDKALADAAESADKQKETEDKHIAELRKKHDELNTKVADAMRYAGLPPEVVKLREQKAEAAKALHEAEAAQSQRTADALKVGIATPGQFVS